MSNPYAPPSIEDEVKGWKTDQRYVLASLALGLFWWGALILPEASREILLEGTALDVLWGGVRVVAIVSTACLLYVRMRRAWPAGAWLSASACLWGGCGVFALTLYPMDLFLAVVAPPFFLAMAWYVVLPMTVVTALALGRVSPRAVARLGTDHGA